MQTKTCGLLIALINLLSLAFTAPYAHHMTSVEGKNGERTCQVNIFTTVVENITKLFLFLILFELLRRYAKTYFINNSRKPGLDRQKPYMEYLQISPNSCFPLLPLLCVTLPLFGRSVRGLCSDPVKLQQREKQQNEHEAGEQTVCLFRW